MKKCITQLAATALGLALSQPLLAQNLELSKNAPDSYTVVKGDTLWDISGRFLSRPWRWPEIWQLNREAIKDPHWIYPGDVVYLDLSGPQPRLRLGKSLGGSRDGYNGNQAANGINGAGRNGVPGSSRLQPMVRSMPLDESAIPTINMAAIDAFLNRPLIVDEKGLATNPRIVATQEGRVYLSRGDKAYVRGITDEKVEEYHIYRQSRPLLDPDTRRPIAYEALYVGSAKLDKMGDPATLRIYNTAEEVGIGDRLMPATAAEMFNVVPRAPEMAIDGRIVSVYRGVTQVGKNSIVAVNRGTEQGMNVGHVLEVKQKGRWAKDPETKEAIRLPDEAVGYMMVFRVFDQVAYGLIMEASESISVGDIVTKP
ncbi:MAG: LysM peptidoglycan-binding domain-containing protein [Burkholderiaceae bacterium]